MPDPDPQTTDPTTPVNNPGVGGEPAAQGPAETGTALPATPAPAAETAPAAESAQPQPAPEPAKPKGILSEGLIQEQPAEGEPATTEEQKPTEEAPLEYGFTFPDGFEARPAQIEALTTHLKEAGLPVEQGQRLGQSLIDMHIAEVTRLTEVMAEQQRRDFDQMREGWRGEFEKSDLGGNRRQTTINQVHAFLRHFASDAEHLRRLSDNAEYTGWADNPDMIRLFANAAKGMESLYREPAVPTIVPMRAVPAAPRRAADRRYAQTGTRG